MVKENLDQQYRLQDKPKESHRNPINEHESIKLQMEKRLAERTLNFFSNVSLLETLPGWAESPLKFQPRSTTDKLAAAFALQAPGVQKNELINSN